MRSLKWLLVGMVLMVGGANAQMIWLEGVGAETVTTGNLLDAVRGDGLTTNVVEVDLVISARSGGTSQQLNATSGDEGSFGINTDDISDTTDAFESGEKMIVSFDKDIQINRVDFNRLGADETFSLAIEGLPVITVGYEDLAQKQFGYFDTNLTVGAHTEIEFYTTGSSIVGLDGIDVTILESSQELELSLFSSNGMTQVTAVFNETSSTNYVLQSCDDLASNIWNTVSAPFADSTNWVIAVTNTSSFFRVIVD